MFCRFMSLKDLNRLQQQAPDTSRPHRQSWSQPALRTRQKRRRQPYKTRLVTAKDWHPTLMNGTFEVRRTNSLSMWTKRMSRKKNIKKKLFIFTPHTYTHTYTHTSSSDTHANTREWDWNKNNSRRWEQKPAPSRPRPFSGSRNLTFIPQFWGNQINHE